MSRITNSNPPTRGDKLTSTDLNQMFTDVNNAFELDGENVRNEGLDQPVFSLNSGHGKSGIILVAAASNEYTTPVTVNANTASSPPFDAAVTVQEWTVVQPVVTGNIIRVYWQFDFENTVSSNAPVNSTTNNGCVWAVWLEYQLSSGGAWEAVENQNDFDVPIDGASPGSPSVWGNPTQYAYGCTIYNHAFVREHSSSTTIDTPPHRTAYGCWWYAPSSDITIYGLRLQCRGLLSQRYVTTAGFVQGNAWALKTVSSGTQNTTINKSYVTYLVMREQ
tara:strand:+ start:13502 stop:14332 length:831 start_codon:yes stop_codon:yes gene_type:complete